MKAWIAVLKSSEVRPLESVTSLWKKKPFGTFIFQSEDCLRTLNTGHMLNTMFFVFLSLCFSVSELSISPSCLLPSGYVWYQLLLLEALRASMLSKPLQLQTFLPIEHSSETVLSCNNVWIFSQNQYCKN